MWTGKILVLNKDGKEIYSTGIEIPKDMFPQAKIYVAMRNARKKVQFDDWNRMELVIERSQ